MSGNRTVFKEQDQSARDEVFGRITDSKVEDRSNARQAAAEVDRMTPAEKEAAKKRLAESNPA